MEGGDFLVPSVDNRVVKMSFENSIFERGLNKTLSSLANLRNSLLKTDATIPMAKSANAIETVGVKFSALQVVGTTVLANLTTGASQLAIQLGKNLTGIESATSGFSEYELKMTSVRTIMNGTGESIERVTEVLGELNEYSDKTIYSFSDMTTAMGKFTNAGIDINTAATAIKGISNAVALAGQGASAASIAFYNIPQSLSNGMRLMDWKSLENANVATKELKEQFIETGVSLGTLTRGLDGVARDADGAEVNFRNFGYTLEKGWANPDVVIQTMARYGDTTTEIGRRALQAAQEVSTWTQVLETTKESLQSGWAQTWEDIFGNKEKATKVFTRVALAIGKTLQPLVDARNEVTAFWAASRGRNDALRGFELMLTAFRRFSKVVGDAIATVFPPKFGETAVILAKVFRRFATSLVMSKDEMERMKAVLVPVLNVLKMAIWIVEGFWKAIKTALTPMRDLFKTVFGYAKLVVEEFMSQFSFTSSGFTNFNNKMLNVAKTVAVFIKGVTAAMPTMGEMRARISELADNLRKFWESLAPARDGVSGFFATIASWIPTADQFVDILKTVATALHEIGSVVVGAGKYIYTGILMAFQALGEFGTKVVDIFSNLRMEHLVGGAAAIGVGAIIKIALGYIAEFKKVFDALTQMLANFAKIPESVVALLDGVRDSIKAYTDNIKARSILTIAVSVGILAASIWLLSTIDPVAIGASLAAITVGIGEFAAVMKLLGGSSAKDLPTKGIKGFLSGGSEATNMAKMATAILALSAALFVFAVAMKILATMSWEELAKGLVSVTVLLGSMAVVLKQLSKIENIEKVAATLIALSTGILILSISMALLGLLSWEQLAKGLLTITLLLGGLTTAVQIIGKDAKKLSNAAATIMALGVALNLLVVPLLIFSLMSWEQLAKGLGTTVILLVAMSFALEKIGSISKKNGRGLYKTAPAILAMGAAIIFLGIGLAIIGAIPTENLIKALVAIAAILTGLALAIVPLSALAPVLLTLGTGMALLGVGILSIGLALALVVAAFLTLSNISAVAATATIGVIAVMISGLLALLPQIGVGIAQAMSTFLQTLLSEGEKVVTAAISLITKILDGIIALIPKLVETGVALINGLLTGITKVIPALVELAVTLIRELIKGATTLIPDVVKLGFSLILAILKGLGDNMYKIVTEAIRIITEFLRGITNGLPDIVDAGIKLIISFINGLADGIRKNKDALLKAVANLVTAIAEAIVDLFWMIVDAGKGLLDSVIEGFLTFGTKLWDAAKNFVDGLIDGITGFFGGLFGAGQDAGQTAVDGVNDGTGSHSPSRKTYKTGVWMGQGLVNGLQAMAKTIYSEGETVGQSAVSGVNYGVNGLEDVSTSLVVRPIIDMAELEKGLSMAKTFMAPIDFSFAGGQPSSSKSEQVGTVININVDASNYNASQIASAIAPELSKLALAGRF